MKELNLPSKQSVTLSRSLTLFPTTAIVIGSVVGSGIFVSSAAMARDLGSGPLLILVWILGGVLTLFGALTICELAAQMPRTGGLYEYLKEIYGEPIGFLYGWANFVIAGSGSIAGIAFIFSHYTGEFIPLPHLSAHYESMGIHIPFIGTLFPLNDIGAKALGAALIVFLTWLNARGVRLGATLQSVSTTAKFLALLAIVVCAFFLGGKVGSASHLWSATPKGFSLSGWTLIGAIAMALSGAFWSYDGWGNVAYIAEEVKDPCRTLPKAIILGTLSFIGLYVLVNLAYLYILPVEAIGKAPDDRVASTMVSTVFGPLGGSFIAALIMLSTFDTVNASILTNARVYLAMAQHGIFWRPASTIHPRFRTPYAALYCQGAWSLILLCTGSFDLIASMYVFVNWVLYVLMALGVFILRYRQPDRPRPFKIPGYPYVPAIFTVFSILYLGVTLSTDISEYRLGHQPIINSVMGLVLVFAGYPFLLYWKKKARRSSR